MRFQLGFTHEKEKSFSPNFFFPLKKGCFVSHVEKQNFTLYHLWWSFNLVSHMKKNKVSLLKRFLFSFAKRFLYSISVLIERDKASNKTTFKCLFFINWWMIKSSLLLFFTSTWQRQTLTSGSRWLVILADYSSRLSNAESFNVASLKCSSEQTVKICLRLISNHFFFCLVYRRVIPFNPPF